MVSVAHAQVPFWTDNFNSTAPFSGDRDAPNHTDGDNGTGPATCGAGDYFFRTNQASDAGNGVSIVFSGFSGSYWRGEDLNGCIADPDVINFTGINISGLANFRFTGSFGANPANLWDIADGDGIFVEYRVDGGAFQQMLTIRANGNSNLQQDTNLDGTADGTVLNGTLQALSHFFVVTGTTLDLRVTVSADDGSEEFAFDDFQLEHSAVLPVELTMFEAKANQDDVLLQWHTVSETNNAGFEIEHRAEEHVWKRLNFVSGQGNTLEAQAYRYTVPNLAPGVHSFRLKQVDYDGTFAYSPEVEISVAVAETYRLTTAYPNPFRAETHFTLDLRDAESVRVVVFDMLGREVAVLHEGILAGQMRHQFTMDGANLPSGMYVYRVEGQRFTANGTVLLAR
ncbi:MAG: hypothetical protein RhofKO_08030 [Rhodothermales bacterium]